MRREYSSSRDVGVIWSGDSVCVTGASPREGGLWEPAASVRRCVSPCVVACEDVCVPAGETLRVISCKHHSTYFLFYREEG